MTTGSAALDKRALKGGHKLAYAYGSLYNHTGNVSVGKGKNRFL